jgi:hypothetical protein
MERAKLLLAEPGMSMTEIREPWVQRDQFLHGRF